MAVEVKKRDGKETDESLIRRFSRRIQQTRVLAKARRNRFRKDEKSKDDRRKEALYKVRIRKEIDRAKKMGHFDEETLKEIRKKMD